MTTAHLHTSCCWFSEKSPELAGLHNDVIDAYIDAYFAYRGYPGEEGGARDREGAGTGDEGER